MVTLLTAVDDEAILIISNKGRIQQAKVHFEGDPSRRLGANQGPAIPATGRSLRERPSEANRGGAIGRREWVPNAVACTQQKGRCASHHGGV